MKKTKYIAATLVLAASLMGAGYAAQQETVSINSTVDTGGMKVIFVEEDLHPFITGFDNVKDVPDYIYTNLIHDPKVTTVEINNLYPGATALFETRIKNVGDIPAIGDRAEVNFSSDTTEAIKDSIICRGQLIHWRPTPTGAIIIETEGIPVDTGVPLRGLEAELTAMVSGMILQPGDFLTFDVSKDYAAQLAALKDFEAYDPNGANSMFFTLPSTSGNNSENLYSNFQIKFHFNQWNQ